MSKEISPDGKLCSPSQKLSSLHDLETANAFISDKSSVSDWKKVSFPSEFSIKDNTSNINPLGLLSFGITGFLVNLSQTGVFPMGSFLASLGIFYGGLGLIICGAMEWKKNHMVNGVTYISFGCFWFSNIGSVIFAKLGWFEPASPIEVGFVLFVFGTFLFVLFFVNLSGPLVVKIIFFTAFTSFWIQAIGLWLNQQEKASAALGTICCALAVYVGFAELLNETYKTTILPLGPTFMKKHD